MTSTAIGLPDRYRPLDQVGPDEVTGSGVISTWRAKDRVLNRDVAIRVHTPGGSAAHAWIARALTAGGLATPALAMVYDAAEGTGDASAPGAAAYVVNEWIEGETLAERLHTGPLPEQESRTVLRRLAEGVAEAHRVGLAVGGLTPENVVLRPNGLVGLRGVPAATGTIDGDIAALGQLLEFTLTGRTGGELVAAANRKPGIAPDLAALVRRTRSSEPGQGLSSAAAMAALLAERPRTGPTRQAGGRPDEDTGRRRRLRRAEATGDRNEAPRGTGPATAAAATPCRRWLPRRRLWWRPPAPTVAVDAPRPVLDHIGYDNGAHGYDHRAHGYDDEAHGYDDEAYGYDDEDEDRSTTHERPEGRRRLLVVGLPLLALALVIGLAVWFGTNVLSVAGNVDSGGSTPPITPTTSAAPASPAAKGTPVQITGAEVFDPYGDGESENARQVSQAYDGDPATSWSTLEYRGSAHFGNLKPGVGVVFDLGSAHQLTGVTLVTQQPGASVEVRTATTQGSKLDDFTPAGTATLDATTKVSFAKPANARYVLVWITGLVPSSGGFSADLAELTVQAAG